MGTYVYVYVCVHVHVYVHVYVHVHVHVYVYVYVYVYLHIYIYIYIYYYHLRSSDNIQIPKVRTEQYKRSFAICGSVLWNSLPNYLEEENSLAAFKRKIENYNFCIDNTHFVCSCKQCTYLSCIITYNL